MKSDFVVPAHWSEKLRAASSTTPRSCTPREASSPRARRVSKVASTGARTAPVIWLPISCMTAPVFAMFPRPSLTASSLDTFAPTLDATPAIGPERLSIMFIMSDSLKTDSKLMPFVHLLFFLEASCVQKRPATGPSLRERFHDCPGDYALLKLLDVASLRHPVKELVDVVDRFGVKCL